MSVDATRFVWGLNLRPTEKLIMLSIADRAGETHEAWPSIGRLEKDTCLDRKTIIAKLKTLCEIGILSDTGDKKGATMSVKKYRINGVNGRDEAVPKTEQSQKRNSSENGTDSSSENGTGKQSQKRDTESIILEPIIEPIILQKSATNQGKKRAVKAFARIGDALLLYNFSESIIEALTLYDEHINSLGEKYKKTELSWKLLAKKVSSMCEKYGDSSVVNAIHSAISSNWRDIYEPKEQPQKKSTYQQQQQSSFEIGARYQ